MMNYEIVEITEIIDLGVCEEEVFDIGMVDNPHTFFANDILVHNSIFFPAIPLIKHFYPTMNETDESFMIEKTVEVATDVQKFINNSYNIYAQQFHNASTHRFKIKQENIAKCGFWVTKKRYAQWLVYVEGMKRNELNVKGLDVVRSDFPPAFKTLMSEVLKDILFYKPQSDVDIKVLDFIDDINSKDIYEIMLNCSVKNKTKYTDGERDLFKFYKSTPAHVKAALAFDDFLDYYGINTIDKIKRGEKVRYAYLKKNKFFIDRISLRGYDDPPELVEFVKTYIDPMAIFKSKIENKLIQFYSALNWGTLPKNAKSYEFFEF